MGGFGIALETAFACPSPLPPACWYHRNTHPIIVGGSPWFWYFWAKAGGDVEAYITNNIPTQSLTAALIITITLAAILSPPAVFENDDGDAGKERAFKAYTYLMFTSTMLNIGLIFIDSVFLEHYHSCSNYETKLNYTAQFGWVVTLSYTFLLSGFLTMASAILLLIYHQTDGQTCYICIGICVAMMAFVFYMSSEFPRWNHPNYMPSVSQAAQQLGPSPPLEQLLQLALKTPQCTQKVLQILKSHGCEDTADLIQYVSDNALATEYTPGIGRFSHSLTDLGIGGFDANRITHSLRPYLDHQDWIARAGTKEIMPTEGKAVKKMNRYLASGNEP